MKAVAKRTPDTAVVYCRISQDATGEAAGVERQRKDCERFCKRRGWKVAEVLVDNDISASSYSRKARPAYKRALQLVEAGEVAAIVSWHIDRLYRRPRDLEDLIDLAEKHRDRLTIATLNGDLDLSTGDGRAMARVLVAMAAKSSDDTSRRLKRVFADKAAAGQRHGGSRAFGYDPVPGSYAKNAQEARLIRKAVKDLLAGESATGIARAWNAAGVSNSGGGTGKWSPTHIRVVMTGGAIAGLRTHQGEIIGPASWPAIIDRATHEQLVALFADPARSRRSPPRRTPFSGLIRCGCCGEVMTRDRAKGQAVYRCKRFVGRPANCGKGSISAEPVEKLIVEAVLLAGDTGLVASAVKTTDRDHLEAQEAGTELAEVEQRLAELTDLYANGQIDRAAWLRARTRLEERQTAARAHLSHRENSDAVADYIGRSGALRGAWPKLGPDRQRAVLHAIVDRVHVAPAAARGSVFDPDRVTMEWKV
jgi:site-specific DNA recombinase